MMMRSKKPTAHKTLNSQILFRPVLRSGRYTVA
jgi:hypothetical protein